METGPIVIGGLDRSGKTLLRSLLDEHPGIAIPSVGSNLWTYFYRRFGDLGRAENLERCLAAMIRYKHVRVLEPDADRIRREFSEGEPTYGRLFALVHEHYAERRGKRRWGEQTGLIERYADEVFAAYPGVKMIHMVRDPRDRYEASLALWPKGKGRAGGATARWLYSVRLARRNQRRYAGRYMVVRYESLVCEPERTLRELCAFLGEDFFPEMLALQNSPGYREKAARAFGPDAPAAEAISTAFVGRFRGAIPPRELAFMQTVAGRQMAAYGYEPEPLSLLPGERALFYAIDLPSNLARMAAWLAADTLHMSAPALFGRRLDPRMIERRDVRRGGASVSGAAGTRP